MKFNPVLIGARYGRLTVISGPESRRIGKDGQKKKYFVCLCDCGTKKAIESARLKTGATTSCGCFHAEVIGLVARTHGKSDSRLYRIWRGMKTRCTLPGEKCFKYYGARGISVCNEWLLDPAVFMTWAQQNGYTEDLTIERKDVNGNYEPSNCCFIPKEEQHLNKRNTIRLKAFGETKTLLEWVKDPRCAVSESVLRLRIQRGRDIEKSLSIPSGEWPIPTGADRKPRRKKHQPILPKNSPLVERATVPDASPDEVQA